MVEHAVETFGPYEILGELAGGAQGVVLEARRDGRRVALKLLRKATPAAILRFEQEGRVLAQLRHPNLPAVLELGRHAGLPFLALEFIDGQDLKLRLRSGAPPVAWAARILQSVAHALQHCHEQGVVHRDVKPANIVLEDGTGRPVLVDFGLLKRIEKRIDLRSIDDAAAELSRSGEIKGTPQYMAPEQISPDRFGPLSARTDVYALGGTLYTLLTGHDLFDGGNLANVLVQVLSAEPPDPARLNPLVPPALSALCRQCLAKEPRDRPPSALAFADALADAAGVERLPTIGASAETRRLAGYEVLRELGRGAMGVVFQVRSPTGGAPLALKLLLEPNPERLARFEREASLMQSLGSHPGIVSVVAHGQEQGLPYLVMEQIEGGTLEDVIATGGRAELLDRLTEIARAVHVAHEAGVIHRDLKPANVLLRSDGTPVITDFGLARDESDTERLTRTGQFVGTVAYMPPEQLAAEAVDRRTDVYALGVMLYQVLSKGALPYSGNLLEAIGLIIAGNPTPPSSIDASTPPALEALCLRAMSAAPDRRPATAEAFARELEVARASQDGTSRSAVPLLAALTGVALLVASGLAVLWQSRATSGAVGGTSPADRTPALPSPPSATTPTAAPSPLPLRRIPPGWYERLPPNQRPALPLPPGVGFGETPRTYLHGADGSALVFVPAGAFRMGSTRQRATQPIHSVLISRGFFLGKHEVRWSQYRRFCSEEGLEPPSHVIRYRGEEWPAEEEHPVFNVSWNDAAAYCSWAGLRLPSEAEWEYAARGPEARVYPWGPTHRRGRANLGRFVSRKETGDKDARDASDGHAFVAPVHSYPAGASWCGALNMTGNVSEWTQSLHFNYRRQPRVDPEPVRGDSGTRRIFRGLAWSNHPDSAFAARRKWGAPNYRGHTVGFRVALSHPSDPGAAYPAGVRAKLGAYIKAHPGDELAIKIWHTMRD